jgi:hypothetical protein
MRRFRKRGVTVLNAKAATGVGNTISIQDYQHVVLEIGTASSANLTCKFAASASETAPTFSSAQSVSNHWDYLLAYDMNDGSSVAGDTGFVVSGTDDFKIYLFNVDGVNWFNANVTARSAGSITVKLTGYSNG